MPDLKYISNKTRLKAKSKASHHVSSFTPASPRTAMAYKPTRKPCLSDVLMASNISSLFDLRTLMRNPNSETIHNKKKNSETKRVVIAEAPILGFRDNIANESRGTKITIPVSITRVKAFLFIPKL